MAIVKITKADLAAKVEEGWKKDKLAEHYGLPMAQMTKVLQSAGLKIRKFHAPKFELIDEEEVVETSVEEEVEVTDVTDIVEEAGEIRMEDVIDESPIATSQGW